MANQPYSLPVDLTCDAALVENGVPMELVKKYVADHQTMQRRYNYLESMYNGFHDIFRQPEKPKWKPDNRLAVNYPRYMTETFLGYAYGIPIKETHPDDSIADAMKAFQDNNEVSDHEYELFQNVCIYGHAFEVLYQDEEAQTRMIACTPQEVFVVYDDTVKRRALFAVRYSYRERKDGRLEPFGEVMTRETIKDFSDWEYGEERVNPYGRIPVVEYAMNRQRIGLFEQACGLIEIYNHAVSEKANDVDAFAEAYLKIIGTDVTDEMVQGMRENRVINAVGDDDAAGIIAEFMSKPSADETQENLLDRLDKQIYQVSMVANISDESFGNATSGTALAYKLQAMSNLALGFDRKIEKSLRKRYKLWAAMSTNVPDQNCWRELQITTSRNLPKNRLEEAQTAAQLTGIVSRETQLSLLSIVPDPKLELEKLDEDNAMPALEFDNHDESQEDE